VYNKILLPVDDSEYSLKALLTAISMQKRYNSKIVAFFSVKHNFLASHIILTFPVISPGYSSSWEYNIDSAELEREEQELGKTVLENVKMKIKDANIKQENYETRLVKNYTPSKYVEKFLKEEGCDLIIIGVKGHNSTLQKRHIGSVTDRIIKSIHCDVLIVK
jgi:nucleotide-binding universal stress UspA family protein